MEPVCVSSSRVLIWAKVRTYGNKFTYHSINLNRSRFCERKLYIFKRNEIKMNSKNSTDEGSPATRTRSSSTNRLSAGNNELESGMEHA